MSVQNVEKDKFLKLVGLKEEKPKMGQVKSFKHEVINRKELH